MALPPPPLQGAPSSPLQRVSSRRRSNLPAQSHGAFRILLHLMRLQASAPEQAPCHRGAQATEALACLRGHLEEAERHQGHRDGFSYEMALLRLARATLAALEAHHRRMDTAAGRDGRNAGAQVHRYIPKTEWLLTQMQRRAQEEHGERAEDWPTLDLQQHQELQGLLDGLVTAYFEREGVLPEFSFRGRGLKSLRTALPGLGAEPPHPSHELR